MDSIQKLNQAKTHLADVYVSDRARIEKLRIILEKEQGRPYSFEEAQEIGASLVRFYRILAGGRRITKGGLKNKQLNANF